MIPFWAGRRDNDGIIAQKGGGERGKGMFFEFLTTPKIGANIGNMIPRLVQKLVKKRLLAAKKIILLLGPRQTGKTTVVNEINKEFQKKGEKTRYLNCDIEEEKKRIDTNSITNLKKELIGLNSIFIDEAQNLSNAGLTLKIIHDYFPRLKVLVTGSSAFELKNKLSDAMTGRYFDFILYPLSTKEMINRDEEANYYLDDILRFGGYPQVFMEKNLSEKIKTLDRIVESYLFKDILNFQKVKNSEIIKNLAKALAYQVGNEVNENELAKRLKIDRKTIISYLDILEQAFVIFRLYPFSNNPRREIGRQAKVFFFDLGIRNALIGDFNEVELRQDCGALWENFLILERRKKLNFAELAPERYFWRTYNGAEVDYLEKSKINAKLQAFEFKRGKGKLSRGAGSFRETYQTPVKLINKENFGEFVL